MRLLSFSIVNISIAYRKAISLEIVFARGADAEFPPTDPHNEALYTISLSQAYFIQI